MFFRQNFYSKWGNIHIIWKEYTSTILIQRIYLEESSNPSKNLNSTELKNIAESSDPIIENMIKAIKAYFQNDPINLFEMFKENLDFSCCTPFQEQVIKLEATIPRGFVSTYRNIAIKLGKPQAFRAVAGSLAKNPFPLIIPCHRTIKSDGSITGYQGGPTMKRQLLEMENIVFNNKNGKIDLNKYEFTFF